jgi:hypothetical protein
MKDENSSLLLIRVKTKKDALLAMWLITPHSGQGILALKGNSVAVQLRYDVSLPVPIRQQVIVQKMWGRLLCRLSIAVMSDLLL